MCLEEGVEEGYSELFLVDDTICGIVYGCVCGMNLWL